MLIAHAAGFNQVTVGEEETFGSSCVYFRISSHAGQTNESRLAFDKRWRPGIRLGYAASWGRSSEVRLSFAYTFLEYWEKKFDK